jgi:glycosyltransferase involved in cell wall biosynthesis
MPSPRVTVGIPFVKDGNLLADAIRSVFAQTLSDWELILVDDGATKDCLSVVQPIQDPRVRFIQDGSGNRGHAYRLNQLTQLARGDYYTVMDADDIMHPERLQRQVEYLDRHPGTHAVASDTYIINQRNEVIGKRTSRGMGPSPAFILKGRTVIHPTVMARSSWFRQNPYDTEIPRVYDCELWCRTRATTVWGHVPEPLFFYRQGAVNVPNYINNCRGGYKLWRRYGRSSLGRVSTAYHVSLLPLKMLAYRLFGFVNAQSILAHWYSERLSPHECHSASEVLRDTLSVSLPSSLSPPEEESASLRVTGMSPKPIIC